MSSSSAAERASTPDLLQRMRLSFTAATVNGGAAASSDSASDAAKTVQDSLRRCAPQMSSDELRALHAEIARLLAERGVGGSSSSSVCAGASAAAHVAPSPICLALHQLLQSEPSLPDAVRTVLQSVSRIKADERTESPSAGSITTLCSAQVWLHHSLLHLQLESREWRDDMGNTVQLRWLQLRCLPHGGDASSTAVERAAALSPPRPFKVPSAMYCMHDTVPPPAVRDAVHGVLLLSAWRWLQLQPDGDFSDGGRGEDWRSGAIDAWMREQIALEQKAKATGATGSSVEAAKATREEKDDDDENEDEDQGEEEEDVNDEEQHAHEAVYSHMQARKMLQLLSSVAWKPRWAEMASALLFPSDDDD